MPMIAPIAITRSTRLMTQDYGATDNGPRGLPVWRVAVRQPALRDGVPGGGAGRGRHRLLGGPQRPAEPGWRGDRTRRRRRPRSARSGAALDDLALRPLGLRGPGGPRDRVRGTG